MNPDLQHAKKLQSKHGTSYYLATLFFPKQIRHAVFSLYGFVREVDEIVDTQKLSDNDRIIAISNYKKEWCEHLEKGNSQNPIIRSFAPYYKQYNISEKYIESFFDSMLQDTHKSRYANYDELVKYMYGSATVVGYMMCTIIGYKGDALPYAKKLSEAMQMTNFLRDIREDFELRNRIYIPKEDMDRFGVTENHILSHIVDEKFNALMKFEIAKTRSLYKEAEAGIDMLYRQGRFAVRFSSRLYEAILDEIEGGGYDIFTKRHRTSKLSKLLILIHTLICKKRKKS